MAALSLEYVLGITPSAVHALAGGRFAYVAGNTGVLAPLAPGAGGAAPPQTLLRGHRGPVHASGLSPDRRLLATACTGADSSVIFWGAAAGAAAGAALAMIESPHAAGTAALDFSSCGRFLITLGQPSPGAGGTPEQEVAVWDVRSVAAAAAASSSPLLSTLSAEAAAAAAAEADEAAPAPSPSLLIAQTVPATHSLQVAVSASRFDLPLPVGRMRDAPALGGGLLAAGFEFVTTGHHSCVFWCATCTAVRDEDAGAALRRELKERLRGAAPSEAELAEVAAAARSATKDVWALACAAPAVPLAPASGGIDKKTGRALPPPRRRLTSSAFLPGALASSLGSLDETVMALGASAAAGGGGAGAMAATATGGGRAPGDGPGAKKAAGNKEMMLPPTGASISAATATGDGALVLWRLAALPDGGLAQLARGPIAAAAEALVAKAALKVVRLTRPETLDITKGTAAAAAPVAPAAPAADASGSGAGAGAGGDGTLLHLPRETGAGVSPESLNVVLAAPSGRHVVVGTEDGAVRIYDLNMRLVGYFEALAAGPVTALSFVPDTGADLHFAATARAAAAAAAQFGGGTAMMASTTQAPPPQQLLAQAIPDLLVCTRRALVVSVAAAAFDSGSAEARRGDIVLEGPDARVAGLAAYPFEPRLALAVGSGCVQLWDAARRQLLLVRELVRAPDQQTDPLTGAARPRLYEPTCIAADPRGRFLGVGTRDGYVLLLDPADLSDVQAALTPAHWPRNRASDGAVTRLAFSPDGYHFAAADEGRHVSLFRFCRQRERRLIPGADTSTAASRLASRRPWDGVVDDADKFREVTVDAWAYLGRAQSHSREITGLSFAPLAPKALAKFGARGAVPGLEAAHFWPAGVIVGEKAVADRHANAGLSLLASVGRDSRLAVYDVGSSSVLAGLQLRGPGAGPAAARTRIEQFGEPTFCAFEPRGVPVDDGGAGGDGPERPGDAASGGARLVVATNLYKLKQWALEAAPQCVRTAMAPTFGGAVTAMAYLRSGSAGDEAAAAPPRHYAVAYATSDRVVGVIGLPLSGNPYAASGVVAHTGAVSCLAASHDGRLFFTSGADELAAGDVHAHDAGAPPAPGGPAGAVSVWRVREAAVAAATAAGGSGITPFLSLLEGGERGAQYAELADLFSYAQVHAQGEASTQPRRAGTSLPVSELAAVMRALGFFPTAEELAALTNEARRAAGGAGAAVAEGDGAAMAAAAAAATAAEGGEGAEAATVAGGGEGGSVDLSTLVRLFVNHRPVVPPSREDVRRAMDCVMRHPMAVHEVEGGEADASGARSAPALRWAVLSQILATNGEALATSEARECLSALLGSGGGGAAAAASEGGDDEEGGDEGAEGAPIDPEALLTADDVAGSVLGLP
jgi:WD40 repeat protein